MGPEGLSAAPPQQLGTCALHLIEQWDLCPHYRGTVSSVFNLGYNIIDACPPGIWVVLPAYIGEGVLDKYQYEMLCGIQATLKR